EATDHGGRAARRQSRHRRHRHRPGRPPRHREEPRGDDEGRRRLQGREPRPRRGAREVRGRRPGARCQHRRHLRPHDDDHAGHEAHHRCAREGRPARAREGDGGRRSGEPGLRRRDRRRWLREGLHASGRQGQAVAARRPRGRAMKARGSEVLDRIRAGETLVFDGGYGTMLFAAGLLNGACPELWNDTHADVVRGIHQGYFDAGSDIVETNTFGGTRLKLNEYQIGDRTRELNEKGARLAGAVAPTGRYVAGSIGPTSRLPQDYALDEGVTDEEYEATFREQAEALAEGGVDVFAVETMMFPQEATAAIRACKAVADLPVMATMFFQYEEMHDRDRTMWGESAGDVAKNLLSAGADIVGMNCGRGPDRAIVIIRDMRKVTDAPLIAYPNAGLPVTTGDTVTYELGPEAMAREYPALLDAGCNVVGACCGSNPEHIRLMGEVVRSRRAERGRSPPVAGGEP